MSKVSNNYAIDAHKRASTNGGVTFRKPLSVQWDPKEDITTFELAQAIKYLISPSWPIYKETVTEDSFWRHFKIEES